MKKFFVVCWLVVSVMVAAEEKVVHEFEETVITAEKFETNLRNTAKDITIITVEEMKGYSNIAEVLKTAKGVSVKDMSGNSKYSIIDLKGQGETAVSNVLILVDGVKINNLDLSPVDITSIPIENIDRIEVMNTGGVMYGDHAAGGVVNIITKKPKKNGFKEMIKLEAGSFDLYKQSLNINYREDNFYTAVSVDNGTTNGYRKNSYYDYKRFGLKNGFYRGKNKIEVSLNHYEDKYGMPGHITEKEMDEDRKKTNTPNDKGDTDENNIGLSYDTEMFDFLKSNTLFSYKEREANGTWGRNDKIKQNFFSQRLKADYTVKEILKGDLITGVDVLRGKTETAYPGGHPTKYEKNSEGYYVQNRLSVKKYSFLQGFRMEYTDYIRKSILWGDTKYTETTNKFKNNAAEIGGIYQYSMTGNGYVNLSTNFRTPNTDEQYSEGLKPQKGKNLEFGIRDILFNKVFSDVSVFYTLTDDEIYYNPAEGGWGANKNIDGETERTGINMAFKENISIVQFGQTFSYVNPKIKSMKTDGKEIKDKEIPGVSKVNGLLYAKVKPLENIALYMEYSYTGDKYSISDWENKLKKSKSYQVMNVRADYTLKNVNFYFGVNNLLNKKYSTYDTYGTNYYPAPEINYYTGMKIEF